MKRQFSAGVCVIVLSVLVGGAFGTYYSWDDGEAGDHYWSSPENWEPNGVPDFGDGVSIGGGFAAGEYPVIGSGFNANASELSIVGSGAIPSLTLESGSSLTHLPYPDDGSSPILLLGSGWAPGQGILNNYGGDVVTRKLWVGYRDLGVLNMTGGTISVQGVAGDDSSGLLEVARGDDCPCPGDCNEYPGHGYVHLDGGVIECDALTLRMGYSECGSGDWVYYEDANGFIDITGGTLVVGGVRDEWSGEKVIGVSAVEQMWEFEQSGWLTAYGVGSMEDETIANHERARIVADYGWRNEDKTTVTAMKHENSQAYDFYPAPYAENVSPLVVLSWKPGDYVAYGGEYMGSPDAKKGNGHHVFIGKLEDMQPYMNSWNPNYLLGTQYGHIVGANDANRLDVGPLMPGGHLEGNTEYVWTVIEVNDANAPDGQWWWRAPLHYFRTRHICPKCWDLGTVGIGAGEPLEMELSWWGGYYTADVNGYMVYLGTDFNEVNDANENDPEYMGTVSEPVWVATDLELGQSYYWRADDVNEAGPPPYLWKGETCSFSIGDYRVVDEFNYDSEWDMWSWWQESGWLGYIDPCCSENGSGAIIRYGWGDMEYFYDNNGPPPDLMGGGYFSEARYEYNEPVDWTYGDAETTLRALALDYEGQSDNSADPNYDRMWVAVEDADGNMAMSPHPEPNAQQEPQWTTWNIDLADFNNAGVALERVKYLYIGFGVRCNPSSGTPGGEGMVTFDNIRLYPQRCVGLPGYRLPGDLNGDCIINREDLGLLCSAWLERDRIIDVIPVADDDPNMLARWQFEGSYENDQYGTAGSVADGIGHGNPSIVVDETRPNSQPGNQVLYLDQDVNEWIDCNAGWADFNGKSFTICGWVNQMESLDRASIITKGECEWKLQFGMLPFIENQIQFVTHETAFLSEDVLENDIWHHVAASWDDVNHMGRIYIDGYLSAEEEDINAWPYIYCETPAEPRVLIGAKDEGSEPPTVSEYYAGYLDDVRVYDRLLRAGEVRWLANRAWQCYEIQYPYKYANIYVDQCFWCCQRIDFKDFAVLAADWLESKLWPAGEGP